MKLSLSVTDIVKLMQGEIAAGQTVKVAYQQGRAQVVARAPAREQQKGVER